jgi:hypothetical protein
MTYARKGALEKETGMSTEKSLISVNELWIGSEEIERMRKEITWLVHTLYGLISSADMEKYRRFDVSYESTMTCSPAIGDCFAVWRICFSTPVRKEGGPVWLSSIELVIGSRTAPLYKYSRRSASESVDPKLSEVALVHSYLQGFLDWMISTFPSVREGVMPFYAAYDAVE